MNDEYEYYLNYKSERYYPGSIFYNNGNINDQILILGKSVLYNKHKNKYIIKFLNSGNIKRITYAQLAHQIIDECQPTVYNRGIIGVGKYSINDGNKRSKQATLWYNMLMRCYCKSYQKKNPTYIGCEVCERWLNFQNFCEDIQKIQNYDIWLQDTYKWNLDKDFKNPGNKIYNLENCSFITNSLNTIISNVSHHSYIGISPDGTEYKFSNMRVFADEHNMNKRGISAVITGEQHTHRGWKFVRLS